MWSWRGARSSVCKLKPRDVGVTERTTLIYFHHFLLLAHSTPVFLSQECHHAVNLLVSFYKCLFVFPVLMPNSGFEIYHIRFIILTPNPAFIHLHLPLSASPIPHSPPPSSISIHSRLPPPPLALRARVGAASECKEENH